MNLYAQSALLAALINLALAVGMLIRGRRAPLHNYYVLLNGLLSAWNMTNFLGAVVGSELWSRAGTLVALFLPLAGLHFFRTFLGEDSALTQRAARVIGLLALVLVPVVSSPLWRDGWITALIYVYIFGSLYFCVLLIWRRLRTTERRTESARLLYLAIGGFVAITFSLVDFLPRVEALGVAFENTPTLGNAIIAFYMYFVSQIIVQYRLLGLSELVGKIAVLAALVLLLTAIYGLLALWLGDQPGAFAFYTLVVAFVLLILFEPMKVFIEERVNSLLFRERFEFARQLALLRREMANVVEREDLAALLMRRLQDSRRVTQASLYLLEDDAQSYRLVGQLGEAPPRFEAAKARAFLDQLREERAVVREDMQDQIEALRQEGGGDADVGELEDIAAAQRRLGAGVSVPMLSEDRVVGVLNLHDDRMREAYTAEEVRALVQIATQAAITIENSRAVRALRERDRLAALGEMAAGLAHEIRNPLGAIKGAAQMLDLTMEPAANDAEGSPQEFLSIIIEEVNRLNGVVSQFLDYARPYRGQPGPCDVNRVLERAEPLWRAEAERWGVTCRLSPEAGLIEARGDAELLRQVFLNLALNAIQATGLAPPDDGGQDAWEERPARGSGEREPLLEVKTRAVRRALGGQGPSRDLVEVSFIDNGRGITPEEMQRLFIPFFTTRRKGTGLGLAISQRLVEGLGGRMEVRSEPGQGATFRVLLPIL
jgi:two-component system sensor histidine kinase HydH